MQRLATLFVAGLLISKPAFCGTADFAVTVTNKGLAPGKAPEGMVWIPGGEFSMGASTSGHGTDEMPMASMTRARFTVFAWMDSGWMRLR
jgi:formylglycine-generating enzyme required for sulfatase activity